MGQNLYCQMGVWISIYPSSFRVYWGAKANSLLMLCWPLHNLPGMIMCRLPMAFLCVPFHSSQATVQNCRQPLGTWLRRGFTGYPPSASQQSPVYVTAGWPRHGGDEWTTVTGESEDRKNRERHGGGLHVSRTAWKPLSDDVLDHPKKTFACPGFRIRSS